MRFEYIDPFADATVRVFQTILGPDVERGDFTLLRSDRLEGDVAIVINVTGESEGSVLLNMARVTALSVGNVVNGRPADTAGEIDFDALGEIANMVSGNATSALNDLGFSLQITPPVVAGPGDRTVSTENVEVFQIPISTKYGEITMNVLLRMT